MTAVIILAALQFLDVLMAEIQALRQRVAALEAA